MLYYVILFYIMLYYVILCYMLDFALKRVLWKVITPCKRISCSRTWFETTSRLEIQPVTSVYEKNEEGLPLLHWTSGNPYSFSCFNSFPSTLTVMKNNLYSKSRYTTTPCLGKLVHRTRLLLSSWFFVIGDYHSFQSEKHGYSTTRIYSLCEEQNRTTAIHWS